MMEVKGITIHNSDNRLSARKIYQYLYYNDKLNVCHFLVDENEVLITTDLTENAWHTGKGEDFGNQYTIAIEICRSQSNYGLYLKAQRKAVRLIKKLMKEYQLTASDIYFHKDFDNKAYCPHRILDVYGSKKAFIERELRLCIEDLSKK